MIYLNHKGIEVDISKISDSTLIALYKFLSKYCKIISRTDTSGEDNQYYKKYAADILRTKDDLRNEITSRKLKISSFQN